MLYEPLLRRIEVDFAILQYSDELAKTLQACESAPNKPYNGSSSANGFHGQL